MDKLQQVLGQVTSLAEEPALSKTKVQGDDDLMRFQMQYKY